MPQANRNKKRMPIRRGTSDINPLPIPYKIAVSDYIENLKHKSNKNLGHINFFKKK